MNKDEKYKLYLGDCLEVMKNIPNKSIDLVLIDPPYNIGKDNKWDKWDTVEDYVAFMGRVFLEIQRVLKDNGSFYFFHNDFLQIVELQNYINKNTNFVFRQLIIWNKNNVNKFAWADRDPEKCKDRNWFPNVEYCLYYTFHDETGLKQVLPLCFKSYLDYMTSEKKKINWAVKDFNNYLKYKGIASHWFWQDDEGTKQPQPRFISKKDYLKLQKTGYFQKPYEELKQEYEELRQEYENLRYTFNLNEVQENISCVWESRSGNSGKLHSCQKPLDILEKIIKTSSNEGDIVLDCFMGSGSTGVACMNTNRNFIGIELDENYFNIAKNRIENNKVNDKKLITETNTGKKQNKLF